MNSPSHFGFRRAVAAAAALVFASATLFAADPVGLADFGNIPGPTGQGEQVEVHLPRNLVAIAARIVAKQEPEIAKLLGSIDSVHVRVVGLDDGNRADVQKRIGEIRSQLANGGWHRIVSVNDSGDDVAIYMRTSGDESIEGVTITVIDHNAEAVLVNVVGSIRPEQIAELAEVLHVPHLASLSAAIER